MVPLMKFKIALIGEAYGAEEDQWKLPFIGPAGQELNRMLADAGLDRSHCYTTNVFNFRPPANDLLAMCVSARDNRIPLWPALSPGKYVPLSQEAELSRLFSELESVRPNLAVLLGNTASWALLKTTAISKIRGAITSSPVLPWLKCLPTYHPAAVLRQYDLRHVAVMDLMKAKLECEFPEVRIPPREIWLDPELSDIELFYNNYVLNAKAIAYDIETVGNEITCIGFATSNDRVLVVPFHDHRKEGGSYWPSMAEELAAWNLVQLILNSPAIKIAQNGMYDLQYLWQVYGITVNNASEDTMLLHHSLQPESQKGLAFLGSVYCNMPAWKIDRPRGKTTLKVGDAEE